MRPRPTPQPHNDPPPRPTGTTPDGLQVAYPTCTACGQVTVLTMGGWQCPRCERQYDFAAAELVDPAEAEITTRDHSVLHRARPGRPAPRRRP